MRAVKETLHVDSLPQCALWYVSMFSQLVHPINKMSETNKFATAESTHKKASLLYLRHNWQTWSYLSFCQIISQQQNENWMPRDNWVRTFEYPTLHGHASAHMLGPGKCRSAFAGGRLKSFKSNTFVPLCGFQRIIWRSLPPLMQYSPSAVRGRVSY